MRWLKRFAVFVGVAYLAVAGLAYAFQERLIFHPRVLAPDYRYDWGEERLVDVGGGVALSTVWADGPGEDVALFFHGNVGDNNRARYQARALLASERYDVVAVDYRGFGKSGGAPESDAQLLADVQAVYDSVARVYPEDRIHLVGYSLGTGMAAYLAAENAPAHLTLIAPYTSLADMKDELFWWLPDFLLAYRLDTRSRIGEIACPIAIYHGTADQLIPFWMAEELAGLAPKRATLHALEGASHRGAVLGLEAGWLEAAQAAQAAAQGPKSRSSVTER